MQAQRLQIRHQRAVACGRVKSDAPEDKLREIERLAFAGCPGINTLRAPVPVETRLEVTRSKTEQAA